MGVPYVGPTPTQPTDVATKAMVDAARNAAAPQNLVGIYSARPVATSVPAGTIYFATDTQESYRSNGTAWLTVGSGGNELAYAERLTSFVVPIAPTVPQIESDLVGASISFIMPERPVLIRASALMQYVDPSGTSASTAVCIIQDVTAGIPVAAMHGGRTADNKVYNQVTLARRITGTPGALRTFKLTAVHRPVAWSVVGGADFPITLGAYTC